ncbi:MAG: hypothetical protein KDD40_11115, partial [Bdellovibrionales bacterium]|nr:hypothetical protein [Bdellovibrionales bacterium]
MRLYNMAVSILFSVLAINVNAVTSKNESLCSLMLSDPTIDFLEGQEAVEALSALPLGSVSSVDGTVVAGLDYFQSKLDQEDSLLENWLNHSIAHDDLKLEEKSGLSADRKLVAKLAGPSIGKVWIKTNKEVAQIDVLKQIKKDLQKKLGLWITAEEVRPISISSDNKTLIVSFGGNLTVTRGYKGKTEETNELQELNATMNLNPLERMFVTNRLGIAYIDIQSRKVTKTFVLPHNEGSLRVLPDKKKALLVNHYGSMSQVNLDVTYGKAFQDLQAQSKKNRYFYDIRVDLMTFLEEISKNLLRDEIDEGELFWFPFLRRSFQSNENGSVKPIANVRSGLLLHENQNQGDYLVFFKTEPAVGLPYLASGYRFLISDLSDKLKGFSRLSRIELIEEKGAYVLLKLTDMSFREKIVRIKNISSDSLEEILVFDSEE